MNPSVFATADGTGSLNLWNLNRETEIPINKIQVSNRALSHLIWSPDGKNVVTGDAEGNLHVYDSSEVADVINSDYDEFSETLSRMMQSHEDLTLSSSDSLQM